MGDIERPLLNNSALKREENSQKSFRIRKYSRSSSRSSRANSARGEREENENNSIEDNNKRTIETPPDLSSFNDINLKKVNLNLREKIKSSNLNDNKFKKDRD